MTAADRARQYVAKCSPAVSGQRGHDTAFSVACSVVWGFGLSVEEGIAVLQDWNARCEPPWTDRDLFHKLESALKANHDKQRGHLLNTSSDNGGSRDNGSIKQIETFPSAQAAAEKFSSRMGKPSRFFTYHDRAGQPVGVVLRWNLPSGEKDIRPVSKNCSGWRLGGMPVPRPLYRLPELLASTGIVCVVEGEPPADALHALGGLTVTTSPHGSNSFSHADWSDLADRDVAIFPDNDAAGKKFADGVAVIARRLDPPARVKIIELPGLGDKEDAVEFIGYRREDGKDNAAIVQEILDLIAAAPTLPAIEPQPIQTASVEADSPSNEAADDQDRLARLFLMRRCQNDAGERTLVFWLEDWYQHDGASYRLKTEAEIQSEIYDETKLEFDRINQRDMEAWAGADPSGRKSQQPKTPKIPRGLIGNVELALRAKTILPSTVKPPIWLDTRKTAPLLALENGLLDLDAAAAGNTVIIPNTAKWFTMTKLPYSHVAGVDCKKWKAFLQQNLEGDAERIAVLQEWFGLNLVFDTSFHKFLLLEGEGANGKGVVCAALQALLGDDNYSSVSLELFGERFQLTPTLGKLANIVADLGEIDRVAEGFLKSFVSGDPMQFDRKNKQPICCPATARITIAMNMRPRFSDRSSGLWRRMILMPMRIVVPQSERTPNMDKPGWWHSERPGLLNWALEGLQRLTVQRRFTTSALCDEALGDYKLESNPARLFLEDRCKANAECRITGATLYDAYVKWAKENGYSPLSNGKFGAEVKRAFPKMRRAQEGKVWTYFGIEFCQWQN